MYRDDSNYNRDNFLNFFNEEKIGENIDSLTFYSFFTDDFTFTLCLDLFVKPKASIFLIKTKDSHLIFDITLKNITKITCNETSLFFYRSKESEIDLSKPDYTVVVKPKVSIDLEL